MSNPLNDKKKAQTIKAQLEMPVQTVSQPSYEEQQKAIEEAYSHSENTDVLKGRGEETHVPAGFELETVEGDAIANQQQVEPPKPEPPKQPTPVVQSRAMSQEELDELTGADILKKVPLVAKDFSLPTHLEPKVKDRAKELRWVNFRAQNGAFYQKALAFGFRNAKPEDIQGNLDPQVLMGSNNQDGIRFLDTILMIIDKDKLKTKYAQNFQKSIGMVQKANTSARNVGAAEFKQDVNNYHPQENENFRRGDAHKVQFYVPDANTVAKQTS